MSSTDQLLLRVRGRLTRTGRRVRGRLSGAANGVRRRLGPVDPRPGSRAESSMIRARSKEAWSARRFAETAELLARLERTGHASFADCVLWARAARKAKDVESLRTAQSALLRHTPRSNRTLARGVQCLKGIDPALLPEVEAWQARVATDAPDLDRAALEEFVRDLRIREHISHGPVEADRIAAFLAVEGGPARVVRALLRASRFDDLEEVVIALTRPDALQVDEELWMLTSKKANENGWTNLAAVAALHVDDEEDEERRAALLATAADEEALLSTPWKPPSPAPTAHEPDPRSVVSVLGQSLPLRSGGYATRSHGILTGLADQGWDMTAVTRLGFPFDMWWQPDDERVPAPVDVVDGVPYHRLLVDGVRHYPREPLPPYVEQGAEGIAALARERRASLVHAASLYDVGMAGLTAARELGVPFVYEMRGLKQLLVDARRPLFSSSPRKAYLDLLEGTVAREADALLVITEALGREMVSLGVDPDRITVVPNGVDTSRFAPRERDEELAERLGVSGKTVIGYVGGLVHYEGLELLFRAAARLRGRRRDFHVLVVGDGTHERVLHRTVEKLGIGDLVTFTGRVPHDDVEGYLSLVDITPFPRRPYKVCELISPIKPFEAMAMHKTVVASDVAALAEIVQDGVTGRLFAKGDPTDLARVLDELLDAPEERARLGDAAREWVVAERDWRRITGVVDGVYRGLLGSSTDA